MARIRKAQRALDRAHQHREAIEQLIADPSKCRGWFLDWADSQLRRDRFYIYSEKEHAVLARELAEMKLLGGFDGLTVPELVRAAIAYRADCDPESEEFLDRLVAERPNELPLWQLKQLVAICRHVAGVPLAPFDFGIEAEEVADETATASTASR